ncbi:MAG: LAGLIDADG family homing endonuclease, partial [Candidatus Micrarchaeota archaeon]
MAKKTDGEVAGEKNMEKRQKNRDEILIKIEGFAQGLVGEIEKGENPHIDIPVRGSSNVSFDEKNKKIVLGAKIAKRYLFNVSHARRFMQTMLVASYVKKDLLENNLTATLRDLYYAKKRTIATTKEDTIDEQKESDLAIVDFEVALDTFRERLHLRAEPKGRMAGDMRIRDFVKEKASLIDLSGLGSGGLAIPSIVEQIEFVDSGIEYVLVAEKNAIFDRLNEDEYWRKQKCLLVTTAGQAARGTRRLLQRISEELKLPIYCLSVDAGEPLMVIGEDGLIRRPSIGNFVDSAMAAYGVTDMGYYQKSLALGEALHVREDGKSSTGLIVNAVRHELREPLLEVEAEGGYSVRVTRSHSLKVFDSNSFEIVSRRPADLKPSDYLVCPTKVPTCEELTELDAAKLFAGQKDLKPHIAAKYSGGADFVALADAGEPLELRWGKSELHVKPKWTLSAEFCRLLGYYASEGHLQDSVYLTFGPHEMDYAEDAKRCAKTAFGVEAHIDVLPHSIRVGFGGKLVEYAFDRLLQAGKGAQNKRVPWPIYNAPSQAKLEFLRGYFRGDGHLRFSSLGCRLQASTVSRGLASDLVYLFHQLGGWANARRLASKKHNELDKYPVVVSDHETLWKARDTVLDLSKGNRERVWKYLQKPTVKLSIRKTVPSELVKALQPAIYALTRRGTSPLVNNQKRIAFEKLSFLHDIASSPESLLLRDKIADAIPKAGSHPLSTQRIAAEAGVKFITAFKALKRMQRKGIACGIKEKGVRLWRAASDAGAPAIDAEQIRRIFVLKNIVESGLVLLKHRRTIEMPPTSGYVYDIEVAPSHSFVTGLGGLLVSNTDADPYGWYIYSTMKYGSMALAHESDRLGCKEMKFLGMSISDIEHYDLRAVTIKAKDVDIKRAQEMKAYDWFKNKPWQKEIDKFLDKKIKAEIQSLSSKNLQYISNTYLPEKIQG